ncbi:PREDICTED: uncharacterized protein LOC101296724 [Fragaria vesca subsp. vesca]|uniref:uncharacterized protein LOC101296724 n=1 Tax=Fragaria vesca subsp. vesca TaxID=101020 RepID=UPI0002C33D63|nr:PREDICTED: uncharacterized protein LOC101296724 [Fragaria vesca subsp. vesca]
MSLIIDARSCENFISKKVVEHFNLLTTKDRAPYVIGWIKKGPKVRITETCKVPISIGKFYQDEVECDAVDMDASHILLGRPWQHAVNTIHNGRENTVLFIWEKHHITLKPKTKLTNLVSLKESNFLIVVESGEKVEELVKDAEVIYPLVVREVMVAENNKEEKKIPKEVQQLLQDFEELLADDLPNELPPMQDIQHQIDLVPRASLPNLPHYRMSPKENEILKEKIEELLRKGHIREHLLILR